MDPFNMEIKRHWWELGDFLISELLCANQRHERQLDELRLRYDQLWDDVIKKTKPNEGLYYDRIRREITPTKGLEAWLKTEHSIQVIDSFFSELRADWVYLLKCSDGKLIWENESSIVFDSENELFTFEIDDYDRLTITLKQRQAFCSFELRANLDEVCLQLGLERYPE